MRNIIDREERTRKHSYSQNINEAVQYQVDFDRLMTLRGTSASSAAWEAEDNSLTVSNTALSANKATGTITMTNAGTGLAKITATQADGNTRVVYIAIRSVDPSGSTRDYC